MVRNTIELLSKETIDRIAAGEVIERPSSVVKELVENSIDAKASAISVEIRGGGKELIRVTDNGIGIPRDEIRTAFLRHSTSKLRSASELSGIQSLGFRGEALASIAAVSEVELLTKCAEEEIGSCFEINGGKEERLEDAGTPEGTTFLIRHLFFNTPARRKFLKSDTAEAGAIETLLDHLALSHPDISFALTVNGRSKLSTSGNGRLKDTIYAIYGREVTENLLEFQNANSLFSVRGYLGTYVLNRGNRSCEEFFVNGRSIEDRILSKALEEGYQGFVMQHQFPFAILLFTFPEGAVDVNVHPSKREIRLSRGSEVYEALGRAVHERLAENEDIKKVRLVKEESREERPETAEPFETKRRERLQASFTPSVEHPEESPAEQGENEAENPNIKERTGNQVFERKAPAYEVPRNPSPSEPTVADEIPLSRKEPEQMSFLSEDNVKRFHIVGQIFDTYWIIEFQGKVYIIDQHAAHEKVNYERMMKDIDGGRSSSQMVSPPVLLSLTNEEIRRAEQYRETLESLGFSFESFGGKEYELTGVPSQLDEVDPRSLFMDIIDEISNLRPKETPRMIRERIATRACKASVKGNQHLSTREAYALIEEMLSCEEPYHCPHGRPTMIAVTRQELDRLFKRIV